jgi:ketosteroid isomerase-like protein
LLSLLVRATVRRVHAVDGLVATFIASRRSRMPRCDVIGVMERDEVDRWLAGYVEAWRTYDRERIAALFSADARYRYHPYDEWVCGREAIVSSWLGESDGEGASTPDQPGTWEAEYRTIAVDGDAAVAVGSTMYSVEPGGPVDRVYDNCFVLNFDADGRCKEFTEWYVKRPRRA